MYREAMEHLMAAPKTLATSRRTRDTSLDTAMVTPVNSTGCVASEKEPSGKIIERVEEEKLSANCSGGSTNDKQTTGGGSEDKVGVIGQRVMDSEATESLVGQGVTVSSLVAAAGGNQDNGVDGNVSGLLFFIDVPVIWRVLFCFCAFFLRWKS